MLKSLLTKAIGEHGMESTTRKQSSASTMAFSWGRRAGRARRTSSPNGTDLQMLARLRFQGVAVLNNQLGLRVSHKTISLICLWRIDDVAMLNSLPHLLLDLQMLSP